MRKGIAGNFVKNLNNSINKENEINQKLEKIDLEIRTFDGKLLSLVDQIKDLVLKDENVNRNLEEMVAEIVSLRKQRFFLGLDKKKLMDEANEIGKLKKKKLKEICVEPINECIICCEKKCSSVFAPCGHKCCCSECAEKNN